MVFGFNTDLKVSGVVYHVQTEDRGAGNPVIDTTIYCKGHILHRRVSSYYDLLGTPGFNDDALRKKLEEQHRRIIEELRSGELKLEPPAPPAAAPAPAPAGIAVQLLNPGSWLAAGTATLEIEVRSRALKQPLAGAKINVSLDGISGPVNFEGSTNAEGRTTLIFPMPRLGPGGTELVIRAAAEGAEDEIRYSLRPKQRPAAQ